MAYNRIEIPTLVREPLPWNLLEVAQDVTPGDDRWTSGINWESASVGAIRSWNPQAEEPVEKDLTTANGGTGEFDVSVIYLPYVCATSGPADDADVKLAKDRLEAGTAAGVEAVFWEWAFTTASEVGATGTASEVVALLGQHMAMAGLPTRGIVHMPSWAGEIYLGQSGFDAAGSELPKTNRGDGVVVGAGYPNVGVLGTDQAVIASGPVGYLLGPIEINESAEYVTSENQRVILAERYVALQVEDEPLFKGKIELA